MRHIQQNLRQDRRPSGRYRDASALLLTTLLLMPPLLMVAGCAKQARPPGGPVDRTAPTVTGHAPLADAIEISPTSVITVDFSEDMDRQRVQEAVFVAPHGELAMEWSGSRQLLIEVRGGLTKDRTYVVTIGTDARDLRSNRLEDSFSFAFSTGARLDSGQLHGRIIDAEDTPQRAAYVWAYDLETFAGQMASDEPAYVTQSGTDGSYRFERLAEGRYRVMGFVDDNRNQLHDEGESLALPAGDAVVDGEGVTSSGDQRLAQRQVAPKLVHANAPDSRRVLLGFDRSVKAAELEVELLGLAVEDMYTDPGDGTRVVLRTETQEEGRAYLLRVHLGGEPLQAPDDPVRGSARQEQKAPAIVRIDQDGAVATAAHVQILFSEAMDTTAVPAAWTGADSTMSYDGDWSWYSWTQLRFTPDPAFPVGRYELQLPLTDLRDLAGNSPADSARGVSFELLAVDALTNIIGVSQWPRETSTASGAAKVHLQTPSQELDVMADSTGNFRFEGLAPGDYVATAWLDRNGNGAWDAGQLTPYEPAEPYILHGEIETKAGDTISVAIPMRQEPSLETEVEGIAE